MSKVGNCETRLVILLTTVDPHENIILLRITPALKKVEKYMMGFNVYVTREHAVRIVNKLCIRSKMASGTAHRTLGSQKSFTRLRRTVCFGNAAILRTVNSSSWICESSSCGELRVEKLVDIWSVNESHNETQTQQSSARAPVRYFMTGQEPANKG
jgi:hypothetical protein